MRVDRVENIERLGWLEGRPTIADIGCYCGNWCIGLDGKGYKFDYIGVDTNSSFLNSCERIFSYLQKHNGRFTYKLHNLNCVSSKYNRMGVNDAAEIKLPIEDASVDIVIAHSIFTHLGTDEAAINYMANIKRILKPGGKLWVTFFYAPPNEPSGSIRRTVYPYQFISDLLKDFKVVEKFGGHSTEYHDQVEMACEYIPADV